jgi:hypothetical protein
MSLIKEIIWPLDKMINESEVYGLMYLVNLSCPVLCLPSAAIWWKPVPYGESQYFWDVGYDAQ